MNENTTPDTSRSTNEAARPASNDYLVTGLFNDRTSAERAYDTAAARGYENDDVDLVMSDEARKRHFADDGTGTETELGTKAAQGAGVGGAIGGAVGAVAAVVAAVGTSIAIPGLGIVVAGPVAAALAGGGAGAATGGLIGALVGAGMPEERIKRYESGIKKGGILMGVRARNADDAEYIERGWKSNSGQDVYR
jgi:hypothetical protein